MSNIVFETKMVTVTDDEHLWNCCYPNNQIRVKITAIQLGDKNYIKVNAWGLDDFGVEIEYNCYNERHLIQMYNHFKHYIYDKIPDVVNRD